MALGKNMKVDKLIPLKKEIEVQTETKNEVEVIAQSKPQSKPKPQPDDGPQLEDINDENVKVVFTPSRRKTQKRILISIEGKVTINTIELIYSKVNSVFESYDFVEVTLKNISEIDLTIIQLFHTIRVSYYSVKKYISINADFSRDDKKLLNACGFTEFQTQKVSEG